MKSFIVASLLAILSVGYASAEELRIGTSVEFPPWDFTGSSNNIVGFDREVGDEVCEEVLDVMTDLSR